MRRLSFFADERGQSTAEYSLVLLVAGAIVGVFGTFVKSGALTGMFQNIVRSLVERAGG
jgi:Flp pilus assembly pilin Flp